MTIKLSKANERYIREKLASGRYSSTDEVIAHALAVFRKVERILPAAQEDLRREIDIGLRDIEQGRLIDWDAESLKRELLQKTRKVS
ncbi:MAG: type II toxin-antitoxin system ParD family antitoxin [Tepidisphaeraceae bacterium]